MSGGSAASTATRNAGLRAAGLGGRVFMRALGPISLAYEVYNAIKSIQEFRKTTDALTGESMMNLGRQATAQSKIAIQDVYKGHPARRYHEDMAIQLQQLGPGLFDQAKEEMKANEDPKIQELGKSFTEKDWIDPLGPGARFENPTLGNTAKFRANTINDLAGLHMKAAMAPEANEIIPDPYREGGLAQTVQKAMSVPIEVRSQSEGGMKGLFLRGKRFLHNLMGTNVDDLGLGGATRGPDLDLEPFENSVNPVTGRRGDTREQIQKDMLEFLALSRGPQFKQSPLPPMRDDSEVLNTREPDTDVADQTVRTNHHNIPDKLFVD